MHTFHISLTDVPQFGVANGFAGVKLSGSSLESPQSPNKKCFNIKCVNTNILLSCIYKASIFFHVISAIYFYFSSSDIFQNGTTTLRNYLHCLIVGQLAGPQIFGRLFVGWWLLLVLLQMMLVPVVLEAGWDLLQDHSPVVKKHWEEPAAVSLPKQPRSVAGLEQTVHEFKYSV
jgi:hypothetical protein